MGARRLPRTGDDRGLRPRSIVIERCRPLWKQVGKDSLCKGDGPFKQGRPNLRLLVRLANFVHVVDMQVDQLTKGLYPSGTAARRRLSAINLAFAFGRPFARMVMTNEGLCRPAPLEADLDLPMTRC